MTRLFNYRRARERKEEPLLSAGDGWKAEQNPCGCDATASLPASRHGGGTRRWAQSFLLLHLPLPPQAFALESLSWELGQLGGTGMALPGQQEIPWVGEVGQAAGGQSRARGCQAGEGLLTAVGAGLPADAG